MDDIRYNFLIGQDGVIYEGRGWGVVGQHTKGENSMSVGETRQVSISRLLSSLMFRLILSKIILA